MSLAHIFKSVEDDWTSSLPIVGTFCDNKCTASSKLPEWLNGSLICIGPGKWDFPKGKFTCNHYCDGFGVLLKFTFKISSLDKSRACTFERQLVQSDAYKKACIAQKPVLAEFGTKSSKDPTKNFLSRMVTFLPESSDNSNSCIFKFGNQLFISNAACFFHEINPSTLEIVEKFDSKKLFGTATFCGNPIFDRNSNSSDGEKPPYYYNVGLSITATGSKYLVVRFPSSLPNMKEAFKKYEIVASIPSSKSMYLSYLPCFGLTENYVILIEQPYSMNVKSFLSFALKGTYFSIMDCFQYIPDEDFKNKFIIINKKTGEVVVKNPVESSEPFFYVNIINTFENPENNEIIIDLFTYPNSNVLDSMTLHKKRNGIRLPQEEYPNGKRFVIPLNPLKHSDESTTTPLMIMPQNITKPGFEYPVVNEKVRGLSYKWFYGTGEFFLGTYRNSLVKMNMENSEDVLMWRDEEHFIPNQPTFISNPTSGSSDEEEEDDGILISLVVDARVNEKTFLVILNARDMKEITRIYFDCLIPPPLHAVFIPKDEK